MKYEDELAQVMRMPTDRLNGVMMEVFSEAPDMPPKLKRQALIKQLEDNEFGGLSTETSDKIERIANQLKLAKKEEHTVGNSYEREYKGKYHVVKVVADGYEYDSKVYHSLSEIATLICGYSITGKSFFKLSA